MPHLKSGDPDLFICCIDHFVKATSPDWCSIYNLETQRSWNVALTTLERLSPLVNAPVGIWRPTPLQMWHWTLWKGYLGWSQPHLASGDPNLFICGIGHFVKAIAAGQCPIWNPEILTCSNVALTTLERLSLSVSAPFGIWRLGVFWLWHWPLGKRLSLLVNVPFGIWTPKAL